MPTRTTENTRRVSDVIEIVDEANGVVLVFADEDTFADYERAELDGTDFDYDRVVEEVLEMRGKIDSFLDELRTRMNRTS